MTDHVAEQIRLGSLKGGKAYGFDEAHDPTRLAQRWFQDSYEGLVLFVVFYSQACRWSRCLGCNLPSKMSAAHVPYQALMAQIDALFVDPEVAARSAGTHKLIASNNGSMLDQRTFSSTALMYLMACVNMKLPALKVLTIETRAEYVEVAELEFLSRALAERDSPAQLELAIGFEAFDDRIRNELFDKGLPLAHFERLLRDVAPYGYRVKCYFMQKPVPGMANQAAVDDIWAAIDYLGGMALRHRVGINMHLNPTYVAAGTQLERAFRAGEYAPPDLRDVARAALRARGLPLTVFIGLSDEGLAVPGGSFLTPGSEPLVRALEDFNRTQDFDILQRLSTP